MRKKKLFATLLASFCLVAYSVPADPPFPMDPPKGTRGVWVTVYFANSAFAAKPDTQPDYTRLANVSGQLMSLNDQGYVNVLDALTKDNKGIQVHHLIPVANVIIIDATQPSSQPATVPSTEPWN
jgi:hypothetical protein